MDTLQAPMHARDPAIITASGLPARARGIYASMLAERGYPNQRKLAGVLEFWMQDLVVAWASGKDLPEDCLNLFARLSAEDNIRLVRSLSGREGLVQRLKRLPWALASLLPLRRAILPGGAGSRWEVFLSNLAYYKLRYGRFSRDEDFREQFLARLQPNLEAGLRAAVGRALPGVLFTRPKRMAGFPSRLHGSPICMLDPHYLRIFFIRKEMHLTGVVHGAHYGEIKGNRCEAFEEGISDAYFHWGLGARNVRQTRFPHRPPGDRKVKRLVWVGSVKPNEFIASYFPGIDRIFEETRANQCACVPAVSQLAPVQYLMHPKYRTTEPLFQGVVYLEGMDEGEVTSSLFVMDKPGNTFLFKAVYGAIPFLLLYNRAWRVFFTERYNRFLDHLEGEGLLYYWDQEAAFLERIQSLLGETVFPARAFQSAKSFLERDRP